MEDHEGHAADMRTVNDYEASRGDAAAACV